MQLGSLAGGLSVSGVVAVAGRPRTGLAMAGGAVSVWAAAKVMKQLVGRGRPTAELGAAGGVRVRGREPSGLGYPSGHAAVALTVAALAAPDVGPVLRAALFGGAAATALARMYVGAHLPLDVAGGTGLAMMTAAATEAVVDRLTSSS